MNFEMGGGDLKESSAQIGEHIKLMQNQTL